MSITGWILVLISSALAVLANLLLRVGVDRTGDFGFEMARLHLVFLNLLKQPFFDVGIIMYGLATLVWIRILSIEPLSVAYPILVSITFVLVTLGAVVLFKESFNFFKALGLITIVVGIFLISRN